MLERQKVDFLLLIIHEEVKIINCILSIFLRFIEINHTTSIYSGLESVDHTIETRTKWTRFYIRWDLNKFSELLALVINLFIWLTTNQTFIWILFQDLNIGICVGLRLFYKQDLESWLTQCKAHSSMTLLMGTLKEKE